MIAHKARHVQSLLLSRLDYKRSATICILFIAVALLIGEYLVYFKDFIKYRDYDYIVFTVAALVVLSRALVKGIDRWFLLFFMSMAYVIFHDFRSTANHVFFSLFLLFPIALFPNKESSEIYSDYVRRCLAIVMIAAATQKLIAGSYLNGDFLKYLASGGDPNENLLLAVCLGQPITECDVLLYISILTVVWQYAIGVLLLINCRHILALVAELLFVLGVGFVTDEMNFQTVNIAALLIAFRIAAPPIVFIGFATLLIIDFFGVENVLGVFW